MAKIFNKKIILKKTKILQGSTSIRCPDINKIKKLGFKQKISLRSGIIEVLDKR